MRAFQLAKELGITSPQLFEVMKTLGYNPPDNHFCPLDKEVGEKLRRHILRAAFAIDASGTTGATSPGSGEESEKAEAETTSRKVPLVKIVRRKPSVSEPEVNGRAPCDEGESKASAEGSFLAKANTSVVYTRHNLFHSRPGAEPKKTRHRR